MHELKSIADHLKSNVNWQRFVNFVYSLDKQLNTNQNRFNKGKVLELCVQEYSDGSLKYVGDTENGCDFLINNKNFKDVRLEMKFLERGLCTPVREKKPMFTKQIKLMSSNGTNKHTKLPKNYADYLMLVTKNSGAVIDKNKLQKCISLAGDGIIAEIPVKDMIFIFEPSDVRKIKISNFDLCKKYDEATIETIRSVK